ncbi:MAG: glycosyltransferase family 4 protein, partial [Opitutaceae bacterium]|nr:glycosyltransferase family 4 protein [Cytophagales bacterium]
MSKKITVIVSHPGKQYVHQLLHALQRENLLQLFITSIWYKPTLPSYKFLLKIPVLGKLLYEKFLKKKQFDLQNDRLIEQFPWNEFKRQLLVQFSTKFRSEKYVFQVEKDHDKYVSKRLQKLSPTIFIGYEKSSLESFKVVKERGGITILDLAQVHFKYLENLRLQEQTFTDLFEDEVLFKKINKVKEEEYKYADIILTLSTFAKNTLVQNGIKESKIKVLNLGYNPAIFYPKSSYSTTSGLRLIYTGTFTKRKGIELLLQAIKELNLVGLELVIIGPLLDGEDLFTKYSGLFTYFDFLHHEELGIHLRQSDVYVFPSYLDSWAMTVVEAMACGLPVIVSESTGAKDAVREGESGFIIPTGSLDSLKEKILFFYNNKNKIKEMGESAVKSAKLYTW